MRRRPLRAHSGRSALEPRPLRASFGRTTLVLLLMAAACATGARAGEPVVRVLLLESVGAVEVAGRRLRPAPDGIDGAGAAAPRWRAPGNGPHRVGDLRVRGAVLVERTPAGLRVLNRVGLEDYVSGTLGREIYPGWHDQTLRAQAVVTRSYALYQMARRRDAAYDVGADTLHQVYGGADAETPRIRAAVEETRGEVLVFGGAPILAAFHSASGGRTASAEEVWGRRLPYLESVVVENEEDSPDTYWRAKVTGTTLGRALAPLGLRLGAVREARVVDRSPSGRARRVRLSGPEGHGTVTGRELRAALGADVLRSTLFEIRPQGQDFIFVGSGHGHGVGMSQWGAEAMAKRGASYRDILRTFYPGAVLSRSGGR